MRRLPQRQRTPREAVAAIIGAEAGIGIGLFMVSGAPLAPLALGALGAGVGAGAVYVRNTMVRRWLRAELRRPLSSVRAEHLDAQSGSPQAGHADDVGPLQGRSPEAFDALSTGEVTAAKLAHPQPSAPEARAGEVAAVKTN